MHPLPHSETLLDRKFRIIETRFPTEKNYRIQLGCWRSITSNSRTTLQEGDGKWTSQELESYPGAKSHRDEASQSSALTLSGFRSPRCSGCLFRCGFRLPLLLCDVAFARSVPLFLVMPIDEVGVILSALPFDYKFIRFPRFLTAFWAYCYHFRANINGELIKYIVYPSIGSNESSE